MTKLHVLGAVALVVALAACDRGGDATPRSRATPTALDPALTGSVAGIVRFTGAKPPPRIVDATNDPTCVREHPAGLAIESIEVSNERLANVFVYIARGLEDRVFAVPQAPVVVDQRGCLYAPRVAGVQVGQPIRFLNSDDTLHNVHGEPEHSKAWNFGLSHQGAARELVITTPEVMVPIRCEVHPWMRAYLGVLPHPYFAVTGSDGSYRFAGVPAGRYVVATWHEQLGTRETTITIEPGATVSADFELGASP